MSTHELLKFGGVNKSISQVPSLMTKQKFKHQLPKQRTVTNEHRFKITNHNSYFIPVPLIKSER